MESPKRIISQAILIAVLIRQGLLRSIAHRSLICGNTADSGAIAEWENPCINESTPMQPDRWDIALSLVGELSMNLTAALDKQIRKDISSAEYAEIAETERVETLPFIPIETENDDIRSWPVLAYQRISSIMLNLHLFSRFLEPTSSSSVLPRYAGAFDLSKVALCQLNQSIDAMHARQFNLSGMLNELRMKELNMCDLTSLGQYVAEIMMLHNSSETVKDCKKNLKTFVKNKQQI